MGSNVATLTAVVMAVAALIAALYPLFSSRAKNRVSADGNVLKSYDSLTENLQFEIRRLQGQVEKMQEEHRRQISEMRTEHERQMREIRDEYDRQIAEERSRATALTGEVDVLRRLLKSGSP